MAYCSISQARCDIPYMIPGFIYPHGQSGHTLSPELEQRSENVDID